MQRLSMIGRRPPGGGACLRREQRGAAGLIFALTFMTLLGMLALALDFGIAAITRSQLELAGDSAALKAVTTASATYVANPSANFVTAGQAAGTAFFQAQLGTLAFGTASAPTVVVSGSNGVFSATVSAQATVPTTFGKVLGWQPLNVVASSAASLTDPKYVAIQILVDTSASMGIMTDTTNGPPALLTAIQNYLQTKFHGVAPVNGNLLTSSAYVNGIININLFQITLTGGGQCAFACHNDNTTSGPSGKSNDYYGIAEANGLQLRIDVLRSAVQDIIQSVQESDDAGYFQFGIYGFSTGLTTIFPLSGNLSAAYTAAANLNVTPMTPYCSYGSSPPPLCGEPLTAAYGPYDGNFRTGAVAATKFEYSAGQLLANTLTPPPTANGINASTPLRYMFIITDGVDDYTTNTVLNAACCNQLIYPFNASDGIDGGAAPSPNVCDQIKAAGVTVLVLYTPYNPVPVATYYNYVQPIVTPLANSQVTAALQACASPGGNFFQANSPAEIQTAMNQMLAIASGKVGSLTH